jgi:hypothetical protein
MSLDTTLYGILSGSSAIQAIVGTRISPVCDETPGETRARLVYQQVSCRRDYDCDGQGPAHGVYQITAWSGTHAGSDTLAEAVRVLLTGYTSATVMAIFVRDSGDVPSLDPDDSARQYGKYIEIELIMKET